MSDELWRWDAAELAEGIRMRTISSREAVASCLARLDAVNQRINAVVDVLADEAVVLADAADNSVAAGDTLGPLHGVPVTVKVNIDQQGRPTTNGVVAFADTIAPADSPPVANWRKAGAIIIGRTNTPAFSWRWFTDNELHGETFNPWDRTRTPGGSSGGAAAAVAAGMCPLAHGNDYGGSIRQPAFCCGIAGIRPTFGRVPAFNPSAGEERPITAQLMSVQGPLARRIRDLRIGLGAMAMRDPRDPWWVPAPLEGPPPRRPIRVALVDGRGPHLHPAIGHALTEAARWLEEAGYVVEEVAGTIVEPAAELWANLVLNEANFGMLRQIERYGDKAIRTAGSLMAAQKTPLDFEDFLKALASRATLLREWQVMFERYPLMLLPVSREPAFELGLDQQSDAAMKRIMTAEAPLLAPAVLGLPGLAVPTGVEAGVPVGVQLVAGRYREDLCFDAGEIIEARAALPTPIDPV